MWTRLCWNAERIGDRTKVLDDLGRDLDIQDVLVVHPGEPGFRFEKCLFLDLSAEAVLNDEIGFLKAAFGITLSDLVGGDNIGIAVNQRGTRRQGFSPIEHAGEGGIFHFDQIARRRRDLLAIRGDQCDRLVEEPHPLLSQNGLGCVLSLTTCLPWNIRDDQPVGQIPGGENASDTLKSPGSCGVHLYDQRTRPIGTEDLGIQHAGHRQIASI